MLVHEPLLRLGRSQPRKTAIISDSTDITYEALAHRMEALADHLLTRVRPEDRVLILPRADLDVGGEARARRLLESRLGLVTETDDPGADLGEASREVAQLPGKPRRDHENVHLGSRSTRTEDTMRPSAARTTSVSGWRTMM